jgi:hypothetical protein
MTDNVIKSWTEWDAHRNANYASEAHRTAARWIDHYGKHLPPIHDLKVGDIVSSKNTGRTGTVLQAHSSGFITVEHGTPDFSQAEEYHHSDLRKDTKKAETMNNWAKWDETHHGIKAKAKEIFTKFKARDGMAPEHAAEEFDRIHAAGSKDAYISKVRLGAKVTQNRKEKLFNVMSFENAYNHAGFELTHKNYTEILKGGVGSGRHKLGKPNDNAIASFHQRAISNHQGAIANNRWADKKAHAAAITAHQAVIDSLKVGVTSKDLDALRNTAGALAVQANAQKEELVEKGTAGQHWHWHDHTGSKVANGHLEGAGFPAKRITHSAGASRFGKRPSTFGEVDASMQGLHNHLTTNGFKVDSNNLEDAGNRVSQHISYSHSDGTTVHSISNQPKDKMTELAHDVAVFHAPEKPAATPDDAGQTPAATPHVPDAAKGVNHPKDHVAVANTILQQYGGNKFRAMTGANNFTASQEKGGALTFRLPKTAGATKGVKFVKTVHDPATDTYDVHMLGRTGDVKHSASGIYADQLQAHFKHHTGLDTHL